MFWSKIQSLREDNDVETKKCKVPPALVYFAFIIQCCKLGGRGCPLGLLGGYPPREACKMRALLKPEVGTWTRFLQALQFERGGWTLPGLAQPGCLLSIFVGLFEHDSYTIICGFLCDANVNFFM